MNSQKMDTIKTLRRNLNKYGSEIKIFIISSKIFINPDIQWTFIHLLVNEPRVSFDDY